MACRTCKKWGDYYNGAPVVSPKAGDVNLCHGYGSSDSEYLWITHADDWCGKYELEIPPKNIFKES